MIDQHFARHFHGHDVGEEYQYQGEKLDFDKLGIFQFYYTPESEAHVKHSMAVVMDENTWWKEAGWSEDMIEEAIASETTECKFRAIREVFLNSIANRQQLKDVCSRLSSYFGTKEYPKALRETVRAIVLYAANCYRDESLIDTLNIIKTIPQHETVADQLLISLQSAAKSVEDGLETYFIPQALWALDYFSSIGKLDIATQSFTIADLLPVPFTKEEESVIADFYTKASAYPIQISQQRRDEIATLSPELVATINQYFPA